jgi:hypothetical protein
MTFLADLVLIAHFLFVSFVVGGFALILAGAALSWSWIRNRVFRIVHIAAIGVVVAESLAGVACPLTLWEDALRRSGPGGGSFVGRWLARLLYYDLPEWIFTLAYGVFAFGVALAWWWIPPRRSDRV